MPQAGLAAAAAAVPDWRSIDGTLRARGIAMLADHAPRPVGGGGASTTWRIETSDGPAFLKTCPVRDYDRLSGEAEGLDLLAETRTLRVPRVLLCSTSDDDAVLAIEWLELGPADGRVEDLLGRQLAAMHRCTGESFGWHRDNTIGMTLQPNAEDGDWLQFFRLQRLGYQLGLARANGFDGELQTEGARLLGRMDRFFQDQVPAASLLHGDLWGGNWASVDGRPTVFDPAVYYGDRETDLAMTRLFGGFGDAFYRAYGKAWPLAPGYRQREPLYQLYHVLNHLNLFGSAWLGRALQIIRRLNAA